MTYATSGMQQLPDGSFTKLSFLTASSTHDTHTWHMPSMAGSHWTVSLARMPYHPHCTMQERFRSSHVSSAESLGSLVWFPTPLQGADHIPSHLTLPMSSLAESAHRLPMLEVFSGDSLVAQPGSPAILFPDIARGRVVVCRLFHARLAVAARNRNRGVGARE